MEEDLRTSLDSSIGGELVRLAPLVAELISQRQVGGTRTHGGAAQGRGSVSEGGEADAVRGSFNLAHPLSRVTQKQLVTFCT